MMFLRRAMMAAAASSASAWEDAITALAPDIWIKCGESSYADIQDAGNSGSYSGLSVVIGQEEFFDYAQASVVPSESSRKSLQATGNFGRLYVKGVSSGDYATDPYTVYCCFESTGGGSGGAQCLWRDSPSGGNFIRLDGTYAVIRVRGQDKTTTKLSSELKDGNPHLIGVDVNSGNVALWVDGVSVWNTSFTGSAAGKPDWAFTTNESNNQRPYGRFCDFQVYLRSLSDTEHADLYAAWLG